MLNLFPIQWLALFAYFILRIFVSLILLWLTNRHLANLRALTSDSKAVSNPHLIKFLILSELIIGAMFLIGLYTQLAAIGLLGLALTMIFFRRYFTDLYLPERLTYVLLLGCALSLLITGAGVLAFDLPI